MYLNGKILSAQFQKDPFKHRFFEVIDSDEFIIRVRQLESKFFKSKILGSLEVPTSNYISDDIELNWYFIGDRVKGFAKYLSAKLLVSNLNNTL